MELALEDYVILESYPEQHKLTFSFVSRNGGYGDRTGQMVTTALTPHNVVVTIVNKEVVSAVMDKRWDELNQRMIETQTMLMYRPMQCQETPWQEWYRNSDIRFVKEPTEEELAVMHYDEMGIVISEFRKVETDEMVCEACDICPTTYYYTASVMDGDLQQMLVLGWSEAPLDTPVSNG
jgi:hypothetical protein